MIFVKGERSNSPARSRVARCSASAAGAQNRALHALRSGAAGVSAAGYHCGRSQPALSNISAPSATWRAWNGLTRSGRATRTGSRGWMTS